MLEKRRLIDKKDDYASFSAEFYGNKIILGRHSLPLGQLSTDFLDLSDEQLSAFRDATLLLKDASQTIYKAPDKMKHKNDFRNGLYNFLPIFKSFLDELDKLPLFHLLEIEQKEVINCIVAMYNADNVRKNAEFIGNFLIDVLAYHDEIHIFRLYTDALLDEYVKNAKKRTPNEYAKAIYEFTNDKKIQDKLQSLLLPEVYDNVFKIEQPVNIDYITKPNPDNENEYIVTERTVYRSISGVLKADLYKALIAGNAPRMCDNCERYFLTIGQEKTLYCNRVAPNDPKGRLCRTVGGHIKAQKLKEIPYENAYSRAYDRLKKRKQAHSIDVDAWNEQVAKIQDIRDIARSGKISDAEAVEMLNSF